MVGYTQWFFFAHTETSGELLAEKISQFTKLIVNSDQNEEAVRIGLARELYSILIKPIEQQIYPDKLLCIIPDKSLNYLPFAALISSQTGRFLIEDYSVLLSPSATAFILLSEIAETKKNKKETLLVLGNPTIREADNGRLLELRAATEEVENIASYYPQATVLKEKQATEAEFRRRAVDADIVHIAAHSVADIRSPLLSKLLLAASPENSTSEDTDGSLHAYELFQIRMPRTRLVILSACETGIGRLYRGEGVMHLARPFLANGVPVVIASLWKVDSGETKNLMMSFHQHRTHGNKTVAQSLRLAQLETLRSSPKSSAWASFQIIGGSSAY